MALFLYCVYAINGIYLNKRRKDGDSIIRKPEEIRMLSTDLTQAQFAKAIGMSLRTYLTRLGKPDWHIGELIGLCRMNDGKVLIEVEGKEYLVSIEEIGD